MEEVNCDTSVITARRIVKLLCSLSVTFASRLVCAPSQRLWLSW